MSVTFQVQLPTNKTITTPKIPLLCWTLFSLCGVVFSNCDIVNKLTKARVSNYTDLTHRHKIKAHHILFLFWFSDRLQKIHWHYWHTALFCVTTLCCVISIVRVAVTWTYFSYPEYGTNRLVLIVGINVLPTWCNNPINYLPPKL